jgi:hypothetical protein
LLGKGPCNAEGPPKQEFFSVLYPQVDELARQGSLGKRFIPQDKKVMIGAEWLIFDDKGLMMQLRFFHGLPSYQRETDCVKRAYQSVTGMILSYTIHENFFNIC